jgi:tetratricopeptide (TPR) repeat protein
LWIEYNTRLLAEYQRAPFPIVCFDLPRDEFVGQVADAVRKECADLVEQGLLDLTKLGDFFDNRLVHHQEIEDHQRDALGDDEKALLQAALGIYAQLCTISKVEPPPLRTAQHGPSNALKQLEEADNAASAGDTERAMTLYQAILATTADPGLIWRRMITLQRDTKASAEALRLCQAAVQACPDDPGLKVQLAEMLQQRGQTQEALGFVEAAIALRPDWGLPHVRRGSYLTALGRWEDAIDSLRRGRSLNPNDNWALVPLGIALLHNGNADEALETICTALERNPPAAHAAIHHRLAQALSATGNVDLSLEHHLRAVSSENSQPNMVVGYARLLMRTGQRRRAREVLQDALDRGVSSPAILQMLNRIPDRDRPAPGATNGSSGPPGRKV